MDRLLDRLESERQQEENLFREERERWTTSQEQYDLQDFASMLKELKTEGTIVGILHTVNDAVADVIKDDGTELLYGRDYFTETLLGLQFKVTPFSFFQTNSRGAEVLYDTARKFLTEAGMKKGVVYDLYCGTGTISQLMAPVSEKVIGVEIVEEAVEAAAENAKRNGIDNCEFIAGDVLKVLDEIEEKPDLIILDPPRDGVQFLPLRRPVTGPSAEYASISSRGLRTSRLLFFLARLDIAFSVCDNIFV